ncbi:unnamed protein product [Cylindrotheca closterium]|uniref:Uncharacterized protein n=1 Tax=Cylindrotheca closterium TaxID=2856 RepID=A0AAD2G7B5_9STRA|nr:unnamed protein product [Cylindrotheca closterium]
MTIVSKSKSVTFQPTVKGIQIMNIDDYTTREISASWYSQEDMDRMTNRCVKVIKRMESGAVPNKGNKNYCMRGLEGHTKTGSITKTKNRASARAAVLMEQSKQLMRNEVNEQAIADAYIRASTSSQEWAQVVGKRDEEGANAIHYHKHKNHASSTTAPAKMEQRMGLKVAVVVATTSRIIY